MRNQSNLRRLTPEEFNAEWLKQLTREGKVFVSVQQETDTETYKQEVLEYVRSIKAYANEAWRERIDVLWQTIVNETQLRSYLTIRKGAHTGHMNRYAVTNIVFRMQGRGVYRNDVSMLTLHLAMEGVKKKNRYYLSCGNYEPKKDVRTALNEIIQEYKKEVFIPNGKFGTLQR
jgi:hypothetical protein